MRILALYTQETLSLQRRVKAPFSALSKEGHPFAFLQVESFTSGVGFSADVTILHNWLLSDEEIDELQKVALTRFFVADCSNPLLLQEERYRRMLSHVHLVTVPNGWMKREVSLLNSTVAILPSTFSKEHFFEARKTKRPANMPITIGCFGPYDWHLVREALAEIQEKYPLVKIIGSKESEQTLALSLSLSFHPLQVPEIIYTTTFGLCPYDGDHAWDEAWEREYGILCRPVIALRPPSALKKEIWFKAIEEFITQPQTRALEGNAAYERANLERSTKVARLYANVYRKKLPHLWRA